MTMYKVNLLTARPGIACPAVYVLQLFLTFEVYSVNECRLSYW